jgi:hypothetical protein
MSGPGRLKYFYGEKMRRIKFYFRLGTALAFYINVAQAINFTECKLEPAKHIASDARARITFTDPYESGTVPPDNLQRYPTKSNLPNFQRNVRDNVRPVTFNVFNIFPDKFLIRNVSLSTAQGELIISPWFFTSKSSDEYYTGEDDKYYTEENYAYPKLPPYMLEWRAKIIYSSAHDYEDRIRIAECKTYFGLSSVTDKEIGARLSLVEFNVMFPVAP